MANKKIHFKSTTANIPRIFKALRFSILGFKAAYKHEAAFRQEVFLFCIFTPLAVFTSESIMTFVMLEAVMLLVLVVEAINSAIEAVVDRISLEHHELSGRAKDLGSLAVTISFIIATMVWFTHLYHYFF